LSYHHGAAMKVHDPSQLAKPDFGAFGEICLSSMMTDCRGITEA